MPRTFSPDRRIEYSIYIRIRSKHVKDFSEPHCPGSKLAGGARRSGGEKTVKHYPSTSFFYSVLRTECLSATKTKGFVNLVEALMLPAVQVSLSSAKLGPGMKAREQGRVKKDAGASKGQCGPIDCTILIMLYMYLYLCMSICICIAWCVYLISYHRYSVLMRNWQSCVSCSVYLLQQNRQPAPRQQSDPWDLLGHKTRSV